MRAASEFFLQQIDESREWVRTRARLDNTAQRDRLLELFDEGRAAYERLHRETGYSR